MNYQFAPGALISDLSLARWPTSIEPSPKDWNPRNDEPIGVRVDVHGTVLNDGSADDRKLCTTVVVSRPGRRLTIRFDRNGRETSRKVFRISTRPRWQGS